MRTHLKKHRRSYVRFLRYMGVGGSTFAFDLVLLFALTEYAHIPYYVATPGAFLIAVSINYLVSRRVVFRGTKRALGHGYLYFIGFALLGAAGTTLGVAGLVTAFGLHYLYARVLVACVVGIGNYLANLFLNFKVAGIHHTPLA